MLGDEPVRNARERAGRAEAKHGTKDDAHDGCRAERYKNAVAPAEHAAVGIHNMALRAPSGFGEMSNAGLESCIAEAKNRQLMPAIDRVGQLR